MISLNIGISYYKAYDHFVVYENTYDISGKRAYNYTNLIQIVSEMVEKKLREELGDGYITPSAIPEVAIDVSEWVDPNQDQEAA